MTLTATQKLELQHLRQCCLVEANYPQGNDSVFVKYRKAYEGMGLDGKTADAIAWDAHCDFEELRVLAAMEDRADIQREDRA